MAGERFYCLETWKGSFVVRAADGLSCLIYADEAAYRARMAPTNGMGWERDPEGKGLSLADKFFAPGVEVPEPEQDPAPKPDAEAAALAALAESDAGMARVVDDIAAWALSCGWTPPPGAKAKLEAREAARVALAAARAAKAVSS